MVPTEHDHILWVVELEAEEIDADLESINATVDVVAKEQ